jgi:hypothetical protein
MHIHKELTRSAHIPTKCTHTHTYLLPISTSPPPNTHTHTHNTSLRSYPSPPLHPHPHQPPPPPHLTHTHKCKHTCTQARLLPAPLLHAAAASRCSSAAAARAFWWQGSVLMAVRSKDSAYGWLPPLAATTAASTYTCKRLGVQSRQEGRCVFKWRVCRDGGGQGVCAYLHEI